MGCNPASTPMDIKCRLSAKGTKCSRRLVGRLIYLTITRPDLSFAIQNLSQFMSTPTTEHLAAVHRVLHYIKNSPGQGIFLPRHNNFQLRAFSDSDWATYSDTRRSVTGFSIYLEIP